MNQKRRKTSSGMKSVKSLTFVCLALNLFGSISYISEGALIQPTLSFTTSGSESGMSNIDTYLAVQGISARLPCDITPPNPGEKVYLVLWYREDEGEPIYSYDARLGGPENGKRWSDEERGFGKRAYLEVQKDTINQISQDRPKAILSYLHIQDIHANEAGLYKCRVDFKTAPTKNYYMNLSVIVPPKHPRIIDETGREVAPGTSVGPYMEGDTVVLKCITLEGDPTPQVTWWRDSHLVDSSFEGTYKHTVQNTLSIPNISKDDLLAELTCSASNNNITIPSKTSVTVEMKFRPEDVAITSKREPLSADKPYWLECRTFGSRPPAIITWWKGDKFVGKTEQQDLEDGNMTISTFNFRPRKTDHEKVLTCRAENTEVANSAIEDSWRIAVHYSPIVSLKFGTSLNPSNIAEGNDVYFECEIDANPDAYKIVWLHNDIMVIHDKNAGIIISGSSLVLQGVSRKMSGLYSCVASNIEGDTQSNTLELKVMYKPICGNLHRKVQGVAQGKSTDIICPVLAHPPPKSFIWKFNNSIEALELPTENVIFNDTHSRLRYMPEEETDFGLVYCWGRNSMGIMQSPCVFQLIPAGPPDPPTNCSVVNQTTDSLEVQCLPGFNGGLQQNFLLEVTDIQTKLLLANATDKIPEFTVSGLNSGRGLKITIYAVNANGRSKSTVIEGFTLKVAQLQVESPVPLEFTPVLGILVGVVLTLMLVAFVVILVLRLKYQTNKTKNNDRVNNRKQNQHQQNNKNKQERTKANNTTSAMPDDKDAEEYYCMSLADENVGNKSGTQETSNKNNSNMRHGSLLKGTTKYRQGNIPTPNELNPDVIPNRHKAQVMGHMNHQKNNSSECESVGSGTPVKLDDVSGYGTADSCSDKTPPYLPTSRIQQHPQTFETICRDDPRSDFPGSCRAGRDYPPYASLEMRNSTNTESQTPLSHTQLNPTRNSCSPVQRQIQQHNNLIQNPHFVPSHQQFHQTGSYRATSPASSINSDRGSRYINPSFQNKPATPLLASMHPARLSSMDTLKSSTFQPQHHLRPSEGDLQGNIIIPNLKSIPDRNNVGDCRLTINPVAKYTAKDREDPQSWAPLLKAAQQESTL